MIGGMGVLTTLSITEAQTYSCLNECSVVCELDDPKILPKRELINDLMDALSSVVCVFTRPSCIAELQTHT